MAERRPHIAVVGTGAVGSALAHAFRTRSHPLTIVSRRPESAERLAAMLREIDAKCDLRTSTHDAPELQGVDVAVLCVPDDAITDVAGRLAAAGESWQKRIAAHTSGLHAASALQPLRRKGADTAAMHPVHAFAPGAARSSLEGVIVTLEGSRAATSVLEVLVDELGGRPLHVDADQKARLHAAASIASNYLVTLVQLASDISDELGADVVLDVLRPLVSSTAENIARQVPSEALTGPISRGDVKTVKRHIEVLEDASYEIVQIYRLLGRQTIALALRGGRITADQAADLEETLRE